MRFDAVRKGNKLTLSAIRNATKPGLYGDGHGLYLQVSIYGTKSWLYRFMLDGVARKMGLGALHTVNLAEARKRAAAARLDIQNGIDPIERKNSMAKQKPLPVGIRQAMRLPAVLAATGFSRSTLYLKIKEGKFPSPHQLDPGGRAVIWWADEVAAWQATLVNVYAHAV